MPRCISCGTELVNDEEHNKRESEAVRQGLISHPYYMYKCPKCGVTWSKDNPYLL